MVDDIATLASFLEGLQISNVTIMKLNRETLKTVEVALVANKRTDVLSVVQKRAAEMIA